MIKAHSFHIPVMGIGFTVDTPLKVSPYGIDSVVSLGDDVLLEKMRKMYCSIYNLAYEEITEKMENFRANRITSYLNLLNKLAKKQFKKLAIEKETHLQKYLDMLPGNSEIRQQFNSLMEKLPGKKEIDQWIKENLVMGSIDVNIMTKLDRATYVKKIQQPTTMNDAHSALRGYANSDLNSSVIFSAGMNPRLYSYIEQFEDFHPNAKGEIKKKIIIKVSDYRSALIQGKFLAKKGLWVSEYRIESGLNCGGHAFATEGYLLGPILSEFKDLRNELIQTIHSIYSDCLINKNQTPPEKPLPVKISAQGGVGTTTEHQFLLDYYKIDTVGWGTPFLLVSEATTVDEKTRNKLVEATEDDLYLSNISPLGIPFHNLRGSTKGEEKKSLIAQGKPGSPCVKKFLSLNNEFPGKAICTASRKYQVRKIKELKEQNLSPVAYQNSYSKIVEKECLCTGLGSSALTVNNLDTQIEGDGVTICPGPNMAYFSKTMSLKEITDHIYGRTDVITRKNRPNMFIKEIQLYIDYLNNKVEQTSISATNKQKQYLISFAENLTEGINYYFKLFDLMHDSLKDIKSQILEDLRSSERALYLVKIKIEKLSLALVSIE